MAWLRNHQGHRLAFQEFLGQACMGSQWMQSRVEGRVSAVGLPCMVTHVEPAPGCRCVPAPCDTKVCPASPRLQGYLKPTAFDGQGEDNLG